MGSTENINVADSRFLNLLERYLQLRSISDGGEAENLHLDEDTLAAFAEGNLTMREATPTLNHLSDCSFCRHKTSELIKLDLAFAGDTYSSNAVESSEPAKVSEVLSGILSRLFGTGDAAVFAHEEKPGETDAEPDKEDGEKT